MTKDIVIIGKPLHWYSQTDEEFAFEWFKRIKPIKKVEIVDSQLLLHFKSKKIKYMEVIEIMGIFNRYQFENREQLKVFKNKRNKILFKNW